jgi:hypothetical protein
MEVKWSVPKNKMNSYFAYLQITMISMLEYLFSRRIMTDFSYFPFYGTRIIILLYLCYAYTKSYTYLFKYFSFITGKLNSLKNVRARENRYGMHAVLNLTGNTFSKIGRKVGNFSGTIRLYHYLRMNSVFFSFFLLSSQLFIRFYCQIVEKI